MAGAETTNNGHVSAALDAPEEETVSALTPAAPASGGAEGEVGDTHAAAPMVVDGEIELPSSSSEGESSESEDNTDNEDNTDRKDKGPSAQAQEGGDGGIDEDEPAFETPKEVKTRNEILYEVSVGRN